MRILLTNDDGADSPGILLLAEALRAAGHRVFMVAPASDASGLSHAISFFKGSRKLAEIGRDSYSFEGTPVDCVIAALRGGLPELDMDGAGKAEPLGAVVSGINRGANLGTDIVFSGTAGAARQGAFYGIPSLALSLAADGSNGADGGSGSDAGWHWGPAVEFAARRLPEMLGRWRPDSFVNVNMPNRAEGPLGLERSFPALRAYRDRIEAVDGEGGCRHCSAKAEAVGGLAEEGSDLRAVSLGMASLSEIFIHPALLEHVARRR